MKTNNEMPGVAAMAGAYALSKNPTHPDRSRIKCELVEGYCPKCGADLIKYTFVPESIRALGEFPADKPYRCCDPDCARFFYNAGE